MRRPFLRRTALVALLAAAPSAARGDELLVFAAISLTDALQECAAAWSADSHHVVRFNLASSSTLALQIQSGAPADVFLSADDAKMDALEAQQLLAAGTRRALLANRLVIVVPAPGAVAVRSPRDLLQNTVRRIAIAEPQTVPAGIYAQSYLASAGLWLPLRDKLVPVENARAALAAVESGNVDAGFVYMTDARMSSRVVVAYEVPVAGGPRISYPAAVLAAAPHGETARRFLAFLESEPCRSVFQEYGFIVVTPVTAETPPDSLPRVHY